MLFFLILKQGIAKTFENIDTAQQLADHYTLQYNITEPGWLCLAVWPEPSVIAKGAQLQTLVFCSKGPRRSPCLNNANRKLAKSLAPQSVVHWQNFCLTITGKLVREAESQPQPRPHESEPDFDKRLRLFLCIANF